MFSASIPTSFRFAILSVAKQRYPVSTSRCMSTFATRHDNDPEVLEKGKQDVLRQHAKDSTEAPHWHEEVASESEAVIKAAREEIIPTANDIKKLVEESEKVLNTKRQKETEAASKAGNQPLVWPDPFEDDMDSPQEGTK